jgi:hypothetical protein
LLDGDDLLDVLDVLGELIEVGDEIRVFLDEPGRKLREVAASAPADRW